MIELAPHLLPAVHAEVLAMHALDIHLQLLIAGRRTVFEPALRRTWIGRPTAQSRSARAPAVAVHGTSRVEPPREDSDAVHRISPRAPQLAVLSFKWLEPFTFLAGQAWGAGPHPPVHAAAIAAMLHCQSVACPP